MKEFKREDYVYVRLIEDFKAKNGIQYKKGELFRYKKNWLMEEIAGRQFGYVFDDNNQPIYEKREECEEEEFFYHQVYQSITVSKNRKCHLYIWKGDYFYLNDWLLEHFDKEGIEKITKANSVIIPDKENKNQLLEMKEGYLDTGIDATITLKAGERLDFTNPAVMALFYDMDWMKFFAKTKVISGKEKQALFEEDFQNAIYAEEPHTVVSWKENPNYDLHEFHYFKLKEGSKIKTEEELKKQIGEPNSLDLRFVVGDDGFLEAVATSTGLFHSSSRNLEQSLLTIADRVTKEEAKNYHAKSLANYRKQEKIEEEKRKKRQEARQLVKRKRKENEIISYS